LGHQAEDSAILTSILFSDKAVFTKDRIFNLHNSHIWAEKQPHTIRQRTSQHKFSTNIWCGIVGEYLLGPYVLPVRLNGIGNVTRQTLPILLENVLLDV